MCTAELRVVRRTLARQGCQGIVYRRNLVVRRKLTALRCDLESNKMGLFEDFTSHACSTPIAKFAVDPQPDGERGDMTSANLRRIADLRRCYCEAVT